MEYLINFLNTLLPILYFISTSLYAKSFYGQDEWADKSKGAALKVTAALHLVEIVLRGIYYQHHPILSIYEAASFLALSIVLIYLYLELHLPIKNTGYFILVFVFFLQLFSSSFIALKTTFPKMLQGPLFIFHTTTGVLGYASLVISAIYSFIYLLLFYDIKKSRFGLLYERLPSLEILQEMNLKTAKLGFFFFSLTIVLGVIWSIQIKEGSPWDLKNLAVYGAWLIYGLELVGNRFGKWSGKKLAYLSLGGLMVLMFSLVVVNLFLTSYHTFK